MLQVRTHNTAQEFLQAAQADLEAREAANGLILGVCGQLVEHPERFQMPVCLKTLEENGTLLLAATMTPPHSLLLTGNPGRMEECAAELAAVLIREGWKVPGVFGPVELARTVMEQLAASVKKPFRLHQNLRMYELTRVEFPAPDGGRLRKAEQADLERLTPWWYAARLEMMGRADPEECKKSAAYKLADGDVFIWDTGEPVSMASKTRPTKRGISIGMVYTPPELRRRGFATACVGELSRMLLRDGRAYCTLYADLANPISNSIYRKIGYRPIGDYEEYVFE
ncbi:MAG: GNAT family N-acetyltransferase [Anaerolineales bacterium]|nr:GNAT family N-acetyltransferase [Anaerolineales bacterium]